MTLTLPNPLADGFPSNELGSTLTAAIAAAAPGATISLATGTYTGNFTITSKTNLTIQRAAGAYVVITSRDPRFSTVPNSLWTPQGAPNVWTIAEVIGVTVWRTDGRKILIAEDAAKFATIVAAGVQCVLREGASTRIYLEGADPNTTPLYVSNGDGACIAAIGSTGLTLRGLNIWFGGAQGVNFDDGSPCHNATIEECTIVGGKDAIRNKNGAGSDMLYRRNWLCSYNDPRWYYRDQKGNSSMEGSAIASGGTNQTGEENFIQGWFNGIGMGPAGAATSTNPIIRRNFMVDLNDDAFELDAKVDVGASGQITENRVREGFVGFSFSPRQFNSAATFPCSYNTLECMKAPLEDRAIPGSQFFGQGTKLNSHPLGTAARYLTFTFNSVYAFNDTFRWAPASQDTFPSDCIATDNVICGLFGPLVRNTGSASAGNSFQRNFYYMKNAGEFCRNWAVDFGGSNTAATLAAALALPALITAGWDLTAVQANPQFVETDVPGSVALGSPAATRGAWLQNRTFRMDSATELATGWILIRGDGFDSVGTGLPFTELFVASMTTAFARGFAPIAESASEARVGFSPGRRGRRRPHGSRYGRR